MSSTFPSATETLGHDVCGKGPLPIIVMNDWLCDTSTWDGARPYLDTLHFKWVFADLRGYGRSRELRGTYTLAEAAGDVLALADALRFERFALVGHSMSTLVALHLSQHHADRVAATVLLTPPPPTGFGADDATIEASRALALGDDATRLAFWRQRAGTRLSAGWIAYKVARWRATSDPQAVSSYVTMFARDGLSSPSAIVPVPVLAVTGEQDAEPMRSESVLRTLTPLCEQLRVVAIAESGHYPMQECPPLLVAHVERFLVDVSALTAVT